VVVNPSDGTGSKFFDPGLGRVSHLWFGSEFGNFPLKIPNFIFLPLRKYLGQSKTGPLIYIPD